MDVVRVSKRLSFVLRHRRTASASPWTTPAGWTSTTLLAALGRARARRSPEPNSSTWWPATTSGGSPSTTSGTRHPRQPGPQRCRWPSAMPPSDAARRALPRHRRALPPRHPRSEGLRPGKPARGAPERGRRRPRSPCGGPSRAARRPPRRRRRDGRRRRRVQPLGERRCG